MTLVARVRTVGRVIRRLAVPLVVTTLLVSCAGSDPATESAETTGASTDSATDTAPLFDEVDGVETPVDATDPDGDGAVVTEPSATDLDSAPAADSTPVDGDAETATSPPSTEDATEDPIDGGGSDDEIDDVEFFPADAVDDVPFCRAYADFFQVFVGVAFATSLAEFELEGEVSNDFRPEVLEVFLYPSVVDDIAVMRDTAPDDILDFFEPLFVRADGSIAALEEAGFTAAEIDAIRAAGEAADAVDGVDDEFADDPRVDDAVDAFLAQHGALLDALDELDETAGEGADDPAQDYFDETCPELSAALDGDGA